MADKTKIEWCDTTWSPVTGCTPISDGCKNCYAKRMAHRLSNNEKVHNRERYNDFLVNYWPERMRYPAHWTKPRKIFVCSMGDLFHTNVRHDWIRKIISRTVRDPQHIYIFLTKRPERMKHIMIGFEDVIQNNIWCGITCENQQTADERMPVLLETPAAVRFVSVEPMLDKIDLSGLPGFLDFSCTTEPKHIDWVICGAETGPNKRPMENEWARHLRDQCKSADVPFFFKKATGETPDDLKIYEFPK